MQERAVFSLVVRGGGLYLILNAFNSIVLNVGMLLSPIYLAIHVALAVVGWWLLGGGGRFLVDRAYPAATTPPTAPPAS